MTIKILKLITGEEIVSLVEDLIDESNNKVGFSLKFPYQVVLRPNVDDEGQTKFDINYIAWMATSANTEFSLSYSSVISIGDPLPEVEQLYKERYQQMYLTVPEE
jgi:hypothetical protein